MRYSTVIAVRRISILKLELSAAHWEIARDFCLQNLLRGLRKMQRRVINVSRAIVFASYYRFVREMFTCLSR